MVVRQSFHHLLCLCDRQINPLKPDHVVCGKKKALLTLKTIVRLTCGLLLCGDISGHQYHFPESKILSLVCLSNWIHMTTNMKAAVAGFSKEDIHFFFIHNLNATYCVTIVTLLEYR